MSTHCSCQGPRDRPPRLEPAKQGGGSSSVVLRSFFPVQRVGGIGGGGDDWSGISGSRRGRTVNGTSHGRRLESSPDAMPGADAI
jgi:hypothetical protein